MLRIVDIFQYLILQYLIVGTLFWHQRIKVVSDLLVQLATVERQESRTKLQQECNRLGNVGVMRFEFLINNLNEFWPDCSTISCSLFFLFSVSLPRNIN